MGSGAPFSGEGPASREGVVDASKLSRGADLLSCPGLQVDVLLTCVFLNQPMNYEYSSSGTNSYHVTVTKQKAHGGMKIQTNISLIST